MQELLALDRTLRESPRLLPTNTLPEHKIKIPLSSPIQTLHIPRRITLMNPPSHILILLAPKLLQILLANFRRRRPLRVRAETGEERFALAVTLFEDETGFEDGTGFEVKVIREGVVECTGYALLVLVECVFEGSGRASEDWGTV